PSNSYFFSTAIHGIRRRSAASASRARVKDFSFLRSCWRAASHSLRDTIGGVFILFLSMCLSFLPAHMLAVERRSHTVVPRTAALYPAHSRASADFADWK